MSWFLTTVRQEVNNLLSSVVVFEIKLTTNRAFFYEA